MLYILADFLANFNLLSPNFHQALNESISLIEIYYRSKISITNSWIDTMILNEKLFKLRIKN